MDLKAANTHAIQIIEKKMALNALTYDNKEYDKIEEDLHDLEDEFLDIYGDELEELLENIHDNLESKNDILLPIAYFANHYDISRNADGTLTYDVKYSEGIQIETAKFPGKNKKIVIIPNPLRVVIQADGTIREIMWQADI